LDVSTIRLDTATVSEPQTVRAASGPVRQSLAEKDRNLVTVGKNGMLQIGAKARGSTIAFTMLKNAVRDKNATIGVAVASRKLVRENLFRA
jgi:hypothetical protein